MGGVERRFEAMGTAIFVLVGDPVDAGLPNAAEMAAAIEADVIEFDRTLSRFRPESELSRLNRDPRSAVPASELLRAAVRAGIGAAERSGGLVDPTLLTEIERLGYGASAPKLQKAPLPEALAAAPPRRAATAMVDARWRSIEVLDDPGEIRRPPGVQFDTGGTGKGLAADLAAVRLRGYSRYAIDCGGDIRIGGMRPESHPIEIEVRHPLTGAAAETLRIAAGAIATSGLDVNVWRRPEGSFAHHLLDPATGTPAWTGILGATARAPSAVEAETLSKWAILAGVDAARGILRRRGGLIVLEDGRVERIGPLRDPHHVGVRLPG